MRFHYLALALSLTGCGVPANSPGPIPSPGHPISLADSDLVAAGIVFGAPDSAVRTLFGPPSGSSTESVWSYEGIRFYFTDGRVHQIELRSPAYETARHLRVGMDSTAVTRLLGRSCVQGTLAFCRTVGDKPDERGILMNTEHGLVTVIWVGAVFDLD